MNDELSEARRKKAEKPTDITPRDALLEAMKVVDADHVGHKVDHVFAIVMMQHDDGDRSFMVVEGGQRNADEIAGMISRVNTIVSSGGTRI